MPLSQTSDSTEEQRSKAAFYSLRDEQRSSRRWQDLLSPEERHAMLAQIARVALAVGRDLYPSQNLSDLDIGSTPARAMSAHGSGLLFLTTALARAWAARSEIIETAPGVTLAPGLREVRVEQGSPERVSRPLLSAAVPHPADLFPVAAGASPLARRLGRAFAAARIAETVRPCRLGLPQSTGDVSKPFSFTIVRGSRQHPPRLHWQWIAECRAGVGRQLRENRSPKLRRAPWAKPAPTPVRNAYPPASAPRVSLSLRISGGATEALRLRLDKPLFTLPARETWLLYE
jgi:hypothetical protein